MKSRSGTGRPRRRRNQQQQHPQLGLYNSWPGFQNITQTNHLSSIAQCPNKTLIGKQSYLVFDEPEPANNYSSTAILRVCNPSKCTDIFYKLYSDYYRLGFKVKSWKGHVYRNSYAIIPITTQIILANIRLYQSQQTNKGVTLSQLLQTKFTLEVSEYVSKYRNTYQSTSMKSFGKQESTFEGKIRIELQCVTRDVLLKMQNECKVNLDQIIAIQHNVIQKDTLNNYRITNFGEDSSKKEENLSIETEMCTAEKMLVNSDIELKLKQPWEKENQAKQNEEMKNDIKCQAEKFEEISETNYQIQSSINLSPVFIESQGTLASSASFIAWSASVLSIILIWIGFAFRLIKQFFHAVMHRR